MKRLQFFKASLLNLLLQLPLFLGWFYAIGNLPNTNGLIALVSMILFTGLLMHRTWKNVALRLNDAFPATDRVYCYGLFILSFFLTGGLSYFVLFIIPSGNVSQVTA